MTGQRGALHFGDQYALHERAGSAALRRQRGHGQRGRQQREVVMGLAVASERRGGGGGGASHASGCRAAIATVVLLQRGHGHGHGYGQRRAEQRVAGRTQRRQWRGRRAAILAERRHGRTGRGGGGRVVRAERAQRRVYELVAAAGRRTLGQAQRVRLRFAALRQVARGG